jgi:hypothetical protein
MYLHYKLFNFYHYGCVLFFYSYYKLKVVLLHQRLIISDESDLSSRGSRLPVWEKLIYTIGKWSVGGIYKRYNIFVGVSFQLGAMILA